MTPDFSPLADAYAANRTGGAIPLAYMQYLYLGKKF
jgi:hypothetical protein